MLAFYLCYPILYLISLLPFPIIYGISNVIKFLIFDIFSYRKRVILGNLRQSFPDKTEAEIQLIAEKFYQYFCDLMLEIVKSISMSKATLEKRCRIPQEALDLVQDYHKKGQSIIFAIGHHGNWEWAGNAFGVQSLHDFYAIFRPLHNKGFNHLIRKIRTRYDTKLISDKAVFGTMLQAQKMGHSSATVFLTDQSPSGKSKYWTKFLSQDTAVFYGVERFALKFNYPIIFADIIRVKRGYYEVSMRTLVAQPQEHAQDGAISELHTRAIEASILAQPETWLWTHRRWKHQRPVTQ